MMWHPVATVTGMRPTDLAFTVGATLRLTRLVTTDDLGEWVIAAPARNWAGRHDGWAVETVETTNAAHPGITYQQETDIVGEVDPENGWRSKLVSGLACPHCVSFHAAWITLAGMTIAPRLARPVYTALTLSAIVSLAAEKLDYA